VHRLHFSHRLEKLPRFLLLHVLPFLIPPSKYI
jgi:hypothetical protein